jgi:hypothetical protein
MKTNSKRARAYRFYRALEDMGFTSSESETLRLAQMTLHRWAERECNGEVERDDETNKTYSVWDNGRTLSRVRCPDRETGALRRIKDVLTARNERIFGLVGDDGQLVPQGDISFYHQTDPRGCALYLIRPGDVSPGADVRSCYTNGFAVCF